MKIAVIGAAGQLGTDLVSVLQAGGHSVIPLTRADLDVTDAARVATMLRESAPQLVINCVAENRVDDCESLLEEAFTLNAFVPGRLAEMTRQAGSTLMHISTDYVFDGLKGSPYLESDTPNPLSAYGCSKFAGEQLVRQRNPQHYLVRVQGLFGRAGSRGKGGNFIEAIINRARTEGRVRVVTDQLTAPTYTHDLARGIADLIERQPPFGIYHLASDGEVSWYDFAREILRQLGLDAEVEPVTSGDFEKRATRPACSVLRSETLKPLRPWQNSLTSYLLEKDHLTCKS